MGSMDVRGLSVLNRPLVVVVVLEALYSGTTRNRKDWPGAEDPPAERCSWVVVGARKDWLFRGSRKE